MSAPRLNSRTHDATRRLDRNQGWINEFERTYVLAATRIRGDLPRQADGARPRRLANPVGGARLAGGRLIVAACLAAWSIGFTDGRAENAVDEVTGRGALNESTCSRHHGFHGANTTLTSGSRGAHSAPIDATASYEVPVWKTITLGTHGSAKSLREAVRCHTGKLAGAALAGPAFIVSPSKREVDLSVLSVAELGFEEGASFAEIHARAARLGLELCPVEVAPQLRLQYLDQPIGEFLHLAMEPAVTDNGDFVNLSVANGGAGLKLIGGNAHPDLIAPPTLRFVFVRPR
jgi:hypothetical protein